MTSAIDKLDPNFIAERTADGVCWVDVEKLRVEGRAWPVDQLEAPYDRFPARGKDVLRGPVWGLSHHSAGMRVCFQTDATSIAARWHVRFENLAMDHMPSTGVSGVDLYGKVGNRWEFAGVGRPTRFPDNNNTLVSNMTPELREFCLYFPLYNGVTSVQIGLPADAQLLPAPAYPAGHEKPVLFYGTSILQGGCASRPGMAYPSILGRWLERPHYNFGFSGNAQLEPETAALLAELDPCAYVLDPMPNNAAEHVVSRFEPFVQMLRKAHPTTPIVLVDNIVYQQSSFDQKRLANWSSKNAEMAALFQRLRAAGDNLVYHVPGDNLLGRDTEATVDGTHGTDLGFMRLAEAVYPTLRQILG